MNPVQQFVVVAIPVLFAITLHEVAHGWVARACGDTTAARLGRLSLNPIRHIDPFGTVILPVMIYFTTALAGGHGMWMGWAKPVPVLREKLRSPSGDMILVALAGPGSNVAMAIGWGLVAKLSIALLPTNPWLAQPLLYMGAYGIQVNLWLCVLNLLPLLPLDGGRVVQELLPPEMAQRFARMEPYGLFILLGLMVAGNLVQVDFLGKILVPFFLLFYGLISRFLNLPMSLLGL